MQTDNYLAYYTSHAMYGTEAPPESSISELQLILRTIKCYMQSLAADLALAPRVASVCAYERECAAKLESDAAGFMRLSLRMYNLIEGAREFQCTSEDISSMAAFVHSFVRESIDVAIVCPRVLSYCGGSINVLREHTILLLNALHAISEEMLAGSGLELGGAGDPRAADQRVAQKRGRCDF